ncbi:hypothetical protein HPG69_019752 [Diceros bicornis minor]|uniref:Small nuclear ribonucleoprotein G n=1 Tax=Diceros bicornis minor TaxID=77932 RepID=A0A7J7ER74_DICBM|nr:hypothetical protein HPG69_019752 [Diceros bicornis minor]
MCEGRARVAASLRASSSLAPPPFPVSPPGVYSGPRPPRSGRSPAPASGAEARADAAFRLGRHGYQRQRRRPVQRACLAGPAPGPRFSYPLAPYRRGKILNILILPCRDEIFLFKASKFMDKKLSLKLNGGRHVQGILRGFDPFMNLVIDECVEMATSGQQNNIGMVVIRGNSIIMLEALERKRFMAKEQLEGSNQLNHNKES